MSREWGWLLILAGFALAAAIMQSAMQGSSETGLQDRGGFGGVLLIGPIPIVFGSSPEMAAASMLLALILLGMLLLLRPREREKGDHLDPANRMKGERGAKEGKEGKAEGSDEEKTVKVKGGAVVMIGPLPIVVGSDPRTALVMMILALLMMVLWALAAKGS